MSEPSFPEQYARTRRFSLGAPRDPVLAPDGDRLLFLRSRGGADPSGVQQGGVRSGLVTGVALTWKAAIA